MSTIQTIAFGIVALTLLVVFACLKVSDNDDDSNGDYYDF